MWFISMLAYGVGLSMDAFAASVCKGLASGERSWKKPLIAGIWFGAFQALMPLIGWLLGSRFEQYVTSVDHWIAFGLLVLIGGNTLREALFSDSDEDTNGDMSAKAMFTLAVATSIDALAVGISLAMSDVTEIGSMLLAALIIGCTTFILSVIGVKLGAAFGNRYKKPAEILGGSILILLGLKILLEHLNVL